MSVWIWHSIVACVTINPKYLEAGTKGRKTSVLARENMIGILPEESPIETATTEEGAEVVATAGVAVEAGARKGCGIETETGAGVAAEAEQEAEVMRGANMLPMNLFF